MGTYTRDEQRIRNAIDAMNRLRETFLAGNNRYGEYGRNVMAAYNNHAADYVGLTGKPKPSIYDNHSVTPYNLDTRLTVYKKDNPEE